MTGTGGAPEAHPAPELARQSGDLVEAVLRFCRALRDRGVLLTPADAVDAARALRVIDITRRDELYLALRAVLIGRVEEYPLFDFLFDDFWRDVAADGEGTGPPGWVAPSLPGVQSSSGLALQRWGDEVSGEGELVGMPTFGDQEAVAEKDFSTFGSGELAEIERLAARLARRLTARPSRRWRAVPRRGRIDPRRTTRRALRTRGDVVELSFRKRKPRRTSLVLVCDVSGSMDLYSRFLLQFLYALQNHFNRVETFVFSTRLARITDQLEEGSYRAALRRLARDVQGWSGGTRIGESLRSLLEGWPRLIDHRSVAVILSDGWDTGDPALLSEALRALRRRAGRVIWLNPLLGSPDYQPLTRGMQAALPHVDVFAPVHNLASLEALVGHLSL